MSACNSAPALRMEYVTALEPPDLVAMHEMVQAYGTLVKVTVADNWRCCRWPDARLALQSSFANLLLKRWDRRWLHGCRCCR
eukprot:1245785-Pyramimonas_sp.AAC.1